MWSYRNSGARRCQFRRATLPHVFALLLASVAIAGARDRIVILTSRDLPDAGGNAVSLFARRLRETRDADVSIVLRPEDAGRSGGSISLLVRVAMGDVSGPPLEPDSFILRPASSDEKRSFASTLNTRTIAVLHARDSRGLLYGFGRLLRLMAAHADLAAVNERQTPRIRERGVYFATHFENYYEGAPLEELDRYVEEMALWGFNQLHFWFDMNWFPEGFWRDPASPGMQMIARLRRIAKTAHAYGLEVGMVGVANEGFRHQPPVSLRADASARRGAYYADSTICPSRSGGMEMILGDRRRVLELVGPIDFFTYWPYDSGGCGCALCKRTGSWGATFLKIGPEISRVVRELNPRARFLVSTWYMDPNERQLVYEQMARNGSWFDGIISETKHEDEVIESTKGSAYSRLVFPEISMFDSYGDGYGTNGANPAPIRFAEQAKRAALNGFGTELYSEGFYDDINKIVWASVLWNPEQTAADIVREYCSYYFGRHGAPAAETLVSGLERTWGAAKLTAAALDQVQKLRDIAERMESAIPAGSIDGRNRWRALRDRAEMDALMKRTGPDRQLAKASRLVFEEAGYATGAAQLRTDTGRLLDEVKKRQDLIDQLYEVHWNYLKFFHMERTTLAFLPDQMLGRINWAPLINPLAAALQNTDDRQMRESVLSAIRRWWWFNGLTAENYFLL